MLTGIVAVVAGVIVSGFSRSRRCRAPRSPAAAALALVGASLLVYLIPILSIAAHRAAVLDDLPQQRAAVVGTLMASLLLQLVGILPGLGALQPYLLSTQFDAWQGLLRHRSTGRRSCARRGCARSTRARLRRGLPGLPAPRRRRRLIAMSERVLVVDDDALVRRMLTRSSTAEGFEVEGASDGGAALARGRALRARPRRPRRGHARRRRARGVPAPALEGDERDRS